MYLFLPDTSFSSLQILRSERKLSSRFCPFKADPYSGKNYTMNTCLN